MRKTICAVVDICAIAPVYWPNDGHEICGEGSVRIDLYLIICGFCHFKIPKKSQTHFLIASGILVISTIAAVLAKGAHTNAEILKGLMKTTLRLMIVL